MRESVMSCGVCGATVDPARMFRLYCKLYYAIAPPRLVAVLIVLAEWVRDRRLHSEDFEATKSDPDERISDDSAGEDRDGEMPGELESSAGSTPTARVTRFAAEWARGWYARPLFMNTLWMVQCHHYQVRICEAAVSIMDALRVSKMIRLWVAVELVPMLTEELISVAPLAGDPLARLRLHRLASSRLARLMDEYSDFLGAVGTRYPDWDEYER